MPEIYCIKGAPIDSSSFSKGPSFEIRMVRWQQVACRRRCQRQCTGSNQSVCEAAASRTTPSGRPCTHPLPATASQQWCALVQFVHDHALSPARRCPLPSIANSLNLCIAPCSACYSQACIDANSVASVALKLCWQPMTVSTVQSGAMRQEAARAATLLSWWRAADLRS